MIVFNLIFNKFAKISTDGLPGPIFYYSNMVAWTYFSTAIGTSGNSLIGSTNLISKVYFPRVIIPITPIIAGLLDFSIAFVVLIGMMAYYHYYSTVLIIVIPLLVAQMVFIASGVGMILSALSVKYRDIKYTIPFIVQLWFFASPIIYPASKIPEKYQLIYALNPMVGVIEGFRSALLGNTPFPFQMIVVSLSVSIVFFIMGMLYFKRTERFFADVI